MYKAVSHRQSVCGSKAKYHRPNACKEEQTTICPSPARKPHKKENVDTTEAVKPKRPYNTPET